MCEVSRRDKIRVHEGGAKKQEMSKDRMDLRKPGKKRCMKER